MTGRLAAICLLVVAWIEGSAPAMAGKPHHLVEERRLMGTSVRIEVGVDDELLGRRAMEGAFREIERHENLISEWSAESQLSAVNRAAGRFPVEVGPELFTLLREARRLSELTEGAFDVTYAVCGRLWSVREQRVPSPQAIRDCLPLVGYRKVLLDPARSAVYLERAGMELGLSGIGKGYRVDRAAHLLEQLGIQNYVVDAGGDLRLSGRGPDGPWIVEIAHPRQEGSLLGILRLAAGAVVTSGDYQWYFERNGVRYHHILDPETGRPARGAVAVTVLAPTAMEADALATGLLVMGTKRGLALAERLEGVEALMVGEDRTVHRTGGFPEEGQGWVPTP